MGSLPLAPCVKNYHITQQFHSWVYTWQKPKASLKRSMYHNFCNKIIYNSKIWKQPKCPSIDKWIKTWYAYTVESYWSIKNNEILPFATTWMDLEIILSEISQTEKGKYCTILHLLESKKYNKLVNITKMKQTHRYGEQISGHQRGEGGRERHWQYKEGD